MRHPGQNTRTLQFGLQSAREGKPLISSFAKRVRTGVLGVCVCSKVALDNQPDVFRSPTVGSLNCRNRVAMAPLIGPIISETKTRETEHQINMAAASKTARRPVRNDGRTHERGGRRACQCTHLAAEQHR
jgi:hypothetical protein